MTEIKTEHSEREIGDGSAPQPSLNPSLPTRAKPVNVPPEVITVDTSHAASTTPTGGGRSVDSEDVPTGTSNNNSGSYRPHTTVTTTEASDSATPTKGDVASQARTPKHANKQSGTNSSTTGKGRRDEEEHGDDGPNHHHSSFHHDHQPYHHPQSHPDERIVHTHSQAESTSSTPPPAPHEKGTMMDSGGHPLYHHHAQQPRVTMAAHSGGWIASSGSGGSSGNNPSGHFEYHHHHHPRHGGGGGAFQPHDRHSYPGSSSRQPPPPQHHHHHHHHPMAPQPPPMQVSPGGGRYYYTNTPPYDPRYAAPPDFATAPGYPQPPHSLRGGGGGPYGGGPPPLYPSPSQGYPGYDHGGGGRPQSSWGPPPPSFPPHGRHSMAMHHPATTNHPVESSSQRFQQRPPRGHEGSRHSSSTNNNSNAHFSRAVSNSFDRSIKSGNTGSGTAIPADSSKASVATMSPGDKASLDPPEHRQEEAPPVQDSGSVSEDASWGALQQVHSVDEEEMRRRLSMRMPSKREKEDVIVNDQPASNSSSLTNSPTEGVEGKEKKPLRKRTKPSSSLDSLSSVASAQEPMDTTAKDHHHSSHHDKLHENQRATSSSPDGSARSYDLIKCPSGSSALLLPSHQRSLSQLSLGLESKGTFSTKPRGLDDDEEREGVEQDEDENIDEDHEHTIDDGKPGEGPASKKSRTDDNHEKKASPLSITCSPPSTPSGKGGSKTKDPPMHQPQAIYPSQQQHRHHHSKGSSSPAVFYDKAPCYTYSMESSSSGPAGLPRDARPDSYPTVPRPGSSNSSSTITPMHVDGGGGTSGTGGNRVVDMRPLPPGVGQIPSWEIHAQDSFGTASASGGAGGTQLMGSFSFQQDYQMLAPSASVEGGGGPPMMMQPPGGHAGMHPNQTLESRDQSFEGGHYHGGGFARSDSMMSYEGRQMSFDGHGRSGGYQGPFPPHAASWGSAASYPAGYGHPSQRMGGGGYAPMMRNYSEDSGARTSPPPSSGMRMMPPSSFPPPPEFRVPPSMVNKAGPQNTILTSPYPSSPKAGPFGWSKEEDARLTEIMKKYKNPRDWGPIAKDHARGRTAKECHERWIRYLKPGVRKGQWTDHEDAVVMEVVTTSNEQPFTRWSDLAQRLPGRVGKQIRDRWVNHLNPAINHLPFSREDDLNLWEGHSKLGKRWVEISTKHFNNSRSENHIKNRWYSASFKKFITNEFGPDAYNGGKSSSCGDSVDGSSSSVSPSKETSSSPHKKKTTKRPQPPIDPSQVEAV